MLGDAAAFANKVKKLKGVVAVALFGSAARGEARAGSDVDVAVIYSEKNRGVVNRVRALAPRGFQVTHLSLEELKQEPTISGALSGEGILLYGQPVVIKAEEMELKPKMLIAYDTTGMGQNDRNRLNRALYGGISTYKSAGKRKVKEYRGLVEEIGAEKLGKGVLLVDRGNYPAVIGALKNYGARWKEIPAWTY